MTDKGKSKLNQAISFEINSIQKQVLDVCELVVPGSNWEPFRKKILDITNRSRRKIQSDINFNYSVGYAPSNIKEDVVKVRNSKVKGNFIFNKGEDKGNG